MKILIADDDAHHRMMLETVLQDWRYETIQAADGKEAVDLCMTETPDLALLDARMPRMDGYQAFTCIHEAHPRMPVIMMTAYSDISAAVETIRNGAWDYLTKPLDLNKLKITVRNAAEHLGLLKANATLSAKLASTRPAMMGESPAMRKLMELINAVAPTEATCLIMGESGTGKELAARAIHQGSPRAKGPFVAINCGALTESLLASELFGHARGAFTGAAKARMGLFAQAQGGVIFLDEIGEMPLGMQVQLLRALQEKEIMPVGSSTPQSIDCRVIAATNRDLAAMVKAGQFREDLFYRLNVVNINMPPLRERKEDIPLLANHFARRFAAQNSRTFSGITPEAAMALAAWDWPGNVRELENVMERAIILMPGATIGKRELPERIQQISTFADRGANENNGPKAFAEPASLINIYPGATQPDKNEDWPTLEEVERKVILETLKRFGHNKTETARALGITRKTLHARLNRYRSESQTDEDSES